jgi:hypothetical protein
VGRFKKQKAWSYGCLGFLKLFHSFPVIPGEYVSGVTGRNQNTFFSGMLQDRPAGDQTTGQAGFKGRALLFVVSKQNWNLSCWHI